MEFGNGITHRIRFIVGALALGLLLGSPAFGQDASPESAEKVQAAQPKSESLQALQDVQRGIGALAKRITALRAEAAEAVGEEKRSIEESLTKLEVRSSQLKRDLETIATGLDPQDFDATEAADSTFSEDLHEVISPAIDALKDVTEESRQTQELREETALLRQQYEHAATALKNLEKNLAAAQDGQLKESLSDFVEDWNVRLAETESQLKAAEFQLAQKNAAAPSFFDAVSEGLAVFFRSRGLNLLVAILIVVVIVFVGRYGHRLIVRYGPMHRKGRLRSFGTRLFDLCWSVGTVLLAVVAFLVTLYLFDDWVLLSVALIFLFGIAWAGKETLPRYFEQGKLLLNLGAVREGERLVYEGIPWKVGRLGFYTDLTNPELEGAVVRLSANDLLDMHSRPMNSAEPWFPTEEGDWVLLGDLHGKVVKQTSEYVRLLQLGGARTTYPSRVFIGAVPVNLSHSFRVRVVFGIDYMHQEISTSEVPAIFQQRLASDLGELVGADNLINLKVEFTSAGASSLDYAILGDFSGNVAHKLRKLERAIQRICVDVCNEQNWVIPFTQVTVHQAESGAANAE